MSSSFQARSNLAALSSQRQRRQTTQVPQGAVPAAAPAPAPAPALLPAATAAVAVTAPAAMMPAMSVAPPQQPQPRPAPQQGQPHQASQYRVALMPDEGNEVARGGHHYQRTMLLFSDKRHRFKEPASRKAAAWRASGTQRPKTMRCIIIMCLNIGVDPPDIVKVHPCATQECWLDTSKYTAQKAQPVITENIKKQYATLSQIVDVQRDLTVCFDTTVEDIMKVSEVYRRNTKNHRILCHFNGHGVPQPSKHAELWVLNKDFTQYIPLSISVLHGWVGAPSIYVLDCGNAGVIANWFIQATENSKDKTHNDVLLLGACSAGQVPPMNPNYPADLFTCCLTCPLRTALMWHRNHSVLTHVTVEQIEQLPPVLKKKSFKNTPRKSTALGELEWIFIAITDTIAWSSFPRDTFQRLFREDNVVATLFRNYLLAERILRSQDCVPVTVPALPPTYQHPLWDSWDLIADEFLAQLPKMLQQPISTPKPPCSFFADQLTAFEVWLDSAAIGNSPRVAEQLPMLLQVLLSPLYRPKALRLLARFFDLGPWAIEQALQVGIFMYLVKMMQNSKVEEHESFLIIWAKLTAYDRTCQNDLVKENNHLFFVSILASPTVPPTLKYVAAFILAMIVDSFPPGQSACLQANLLPVLSQLLDHPDSRVRLWSVLCLGKLWENYEEAKAAVLKAAASPPLLRMLQDPVPEVRAAVVYALGTFIGSGHAVSEARYNVECSVCCSLATVALDASPVVRRELVVALSKVVAAYRHQFASIIATKKSIESGKSPDTTRPEAPQIFVWLWSTLIGEMLYDPSEDVMALAETLRTSVVVGPTGGAPTGGSGAASSEQIRLRSAFFAWCAEHFRTSGLLERRQQQEADARAAAWAKVSGEVTRGAVEMCRDADRSKFKYERTTLTDLTAPAVALLCHPVHDILVVADDASSISTWDTKERRPQHTFLNRNAVGSRVTHLSFVNEADLSPLLAVGSSDGVVRIWRDFAHATSCELASTWRAVPYPPDTPSGAKGLVCDWMDSGSMLAAGNSDHVKLWDVQTELATLDVPTGCNRAVTALTSDRVGGRTFAIGCGDGTVRLFDARAPSRCAHMCAPPLLVDARHYVINTFWPLANGQRLVYAASASGDIRLYDLSGTSGQPVATAVHKGLSSFVMHAHAPLVASGSLDQSIRVYSSNSLSDVSTIKFHEGFLGQRIGCVNCLAFHPTRPLLAAGCSDAWVSVWSNSAVSATPTPASGGNAPVPSPHGSPTGTPAELPLASSLGSPGTPGMLVPPVIHTGRGAAHTPPGSYVGDTQPRAPPVRHTASAMDLNMRSGNF
eukprot:TRINITY_DN5399_c0_g1_i1.p1 TRINITY_DN5399_c0_g1~~TRINITY_DN5399_c0_g1_i1.p1  ORF type:complete len:1313 (-),score=293.10 TRINITY_DN5399_c0_g1_i1:67-4005(-)